MVSENKLSEGVNTITQIGNTIRRIPGEWTPSIHALLSHIRNKGILFVPEPLGYDELGREMLSYLEGETGDYTLTREARSNNALISAAKCLRAYHDATIDFLPLYNDNGIWQLKNHPPIEVICHGDFAPYNCVFKNDKVVGLFDFDMAHPGSRVWDIAYAVYRFAPLMAPENSESFGTQTQQAQRLKLFCETYGLQNRNNLLSTIIERLLFLVYYLYEQANLGKKIYQQFISEGHDQLYLKDIQYIKSNSEFFQDFIMS